MNCSFAKIIYKYEADDDTASGASDRRRNPRDVQFC